MDSVISNVEIKKQIFEKVASIASTFGSPARLKILQILAQAPRSVETISEITGDSVANTSQHLQKLLKEGLVKVSKEKLLRIYSLNDNIIALILEELFNLAEKISPQIVVMQESLIGSKVGKSIEIETILPELKNNKAVLLDVREEYEVSNSKLEKAIAIPLGQLKQKAKKLDKNKTYYLVCRGRVCELATEGVKILRDLGFKAYRLKESPASIKIKL